MGRSKSMFWSKPDNISLYSQIGGRTEVREFLTMNLNLPKTSRDMFPIINLVRHGRIPDYAMDHYLTPQGREEAIARGRELAETVISGETISFYSGPARRARQTAALVQAGLQTALAEKNIEVTIRPTIAVEDILENCQCILDGLHYDLMYPLLDAARWQSQQNAPADAQACADFLYNLWHTADDAMAYWLDYSGPGAESVKAVNQRTLAFVENRFDSPVVAESPQRHVAVTHSGNLRAYLRLAFGSDIGHKMPYVDVITVTNEQVYYQADVTSRPKLE